MGRPQYGHSRQFEADRLVRAALWLAALALGLSFSPITPAATTLKLVEVITSPERTETLKSIVKTFEDANPDVRVEITSLSWGPSFEKFATMVAAGDTPDVVEMPDVWLGLYANNGALESLEPYLKTWPHTQELNQRTLQLARMVRNTAYMLPYGFYLRALYYSKKLFAAAGVSVPPRTLDEFVAVSKKVSSLPGKYGYCLRGGAGQLGEFSHETLDREYVVVGAKRPHRRNPDRHRRDEVMHHMRIGEGVDRDRVAVAAAFRQWQRLRIRHRERLGRVFQGRRELDLYRPRVDQGLQHFGGHL